MENFFFNLKDHDAATAIMTMLVLVMVVGTFAQIIADKVRIPATGPLLFAGLVFGKAGLGLIQPELLGDVLPVIVKASVAIVVFEGGMLLDVRNIRHASRAVLGLVTVGLLITTILSGVLVHFLFGWGWELSFLFGAIVSVTGPTVITPILEKVKVNRRVRSTLESESIIADPLGVILASLVFTAIISPKGLTSAIPTGLITLGAGILVGFGIALIVWILSDRFRLLPSKFSRIGILGAALVSYTLAELIAHEAGVLAAAIAGISIGSLSIPHKDQIEEFKGDLSTISISAVFILLSSGLVISDITSLGLPGIIAVVSMIMIVRPVRVFASTLGSELKTNEKWFISFMGPRGIVAASVATFFAFELKDLNINGAESFTALVFAVILATVLTQGTFAEQSAKFFRVMPKHILIIGADETARLLAERLANAGETISMIDTDHENCEQAKDLRETNIFCADATDPDILRKAGIKEAKTVIVATPSDKVNILICQAIKAEFDENRLVARVNSTANISAFESAGIEAMSPPSAAATILENMVLRPSLFNFLSKGMGEERMKEVVLGSMRKGITISSLGLKNVVIVAVRRDDDLITPRGDTELIAGDVLTILGESVHLDKAMDKIG